MIYKTIIIAIIGLLIPACSSNPSGDLTREVAGAILNKQLATSQVRLIAFNKGGSESAVADGILNFHRPIIGPDDYIYTPRGEELFGSFSNVKWREGKELSVELNSPIGERLSEVTGIAPGSMPNVFDVEFTTEYLFTPSMQQMTRYLYSGRKARASFRKYDDGWRVENVQ